MDITNYLKAGYPALFIQTLEPLRAISSLNCGTNDLFSWDCLKGITTPNGMMLEDIMDPSMAVKWLASKTDTVLIVQNFHHFIGSVEIIQQIQNYMPFFKASGCCLVMVGPVCVLPPEIGTFFTVLDFKRLNLDEIRSIQAELAQSVGVTPDEASAEAALGLTEFESETAFAYSLVTKKRFCPEVITGQKMQMIKRTGLMEFWPPVSIEEVGGLDQLKNYIANRKKAFLPEYAHLPKPKAILLVGTPGCGKSLTCKAAASVLGWPLIRLDISALKGSLVGESERKIRMATDTIDAFGKAVIWLEEASQHIIPLSRTMKEDIEALRKWAGTRARTANTQHHEAPQPNPIRRIK